MLTHFNYWLSGSGWSDVFFSNGKVNVRFDCSYLSDPLDELFDSLAKMNVGDLDSLDISFMDEPGQNRLALLKRSDREVDVSIVWDSSWNREIVIDSSFAKQNILYTDSDTLINFSMVVCNGIDDLLSRHTLEEYKKIWCSEFPLEKYRRLKSLLG